ncbi:hypothetical protein MY5147_009058 [Beauveria neobassiana]
MARVKSNKKSSDTLNQRLALVVKSGKISLGYSSTLKALRQGKAKLVLIAANTPPLRKSELEYYAMLSKSALHHFAGTNICRSASDFTLNPISIDMGTACGRLFRCGVMVVLDPSDSDILSEQA